MEKEEEDVTASSQPGSKPSSISCPGPPRAPTPQLTTGPLGAKSGPAGPPREHSELKGLAEKVRMAVYWMAIEASANSTMDFQEHCMVSGQPHLDATRPSVERKRADMEGWRDKERCRGVNWVYGKVLQLPCLGSREKKEKNVLLKVNS